MKIILLLGPLGVGVLMQACIYQAMHGDITYASISGGAMMFGIVAELKLAIMSLRL